MRDGFIGGVHPLYDNFLYFLAHSLIQVKYFLPLLSILSQLSLFKIFHLSEEWKVVSLTPQVEGGFRGISNGGCINLPPINPEFFSDILATASRLNTLYGL